MAWTDQCKIAFEMTVIAKKHSSDADKSLNSILRDVSHESDIPVGTLKRWWAEAQKTKQFENEPPEENTKKTNSKAEIKEIKRKPAKDGTMRGGSRKGAGRKPKDKSKQLKEKSVPKNGNRKKDFCDSIVQRADRLFNDIDKRYSGEPSISIKLKFKIAIMLLIGTKGEAKKAGFDDVKMMESALNEMVENIYEDRVLVK